MVIGPLLYLLFCEVVTIVRCYIIWDARPTNQEFHKPIDSGAG